MNLLEWFTSYLESKKMTARQWFEEHFQAEEAPVMPQRIRQDEDAPNLFIGKIIEDSNIKCEVVDVHNTNIHVKILEIKWDRLGTYLDIGKTYPVFKHSSQYLGDDMQIWEIAPKHMKRSTSQVLLYWEKDVGWTWDLDF